jgi:site-specific DNA recombinase
MSVGAPNVKRPVRRDLVETVTVSRDMSRRGGLVVDIAGRLTARLGAPAYLSGAKRVAGKVVAEEGLEPPTQGL